MRLWSLHPRYLDPKGLVALWREALLAQAVLAGRTRGYRHHPQLRRFAAVPAPQAAIASYLHEVQREAVRRGYRFDAGRIDQGKGQPAPLVVTTGQLDYERQHLQRKLMLRAPDCLQALAADAEVEAHPLFIVRPGGIADWEVPG
jgi:hypothetical protein